MKKALSILLIIAMVLSLTSCGTQTVSKGKFTLKLKGNGSKTIKLTISDRLDSYTSRTFNLSEENILGLTVAEKSGDHSVTYTIKAASPGSTSAFVEYLCEDESQEIVSFQLYADEKGKLKCDNIYFGNDKKYKDKENPDDEYEISEYEGEAVTIRLANGKGVWKTASCDTLVEVVSEEVSAEYSEITIRALAEGEGSIQIVNRKEEKQFYFNLKVDKASDGSLILNVVSVERGSFTHEDDKELIEKREKAKEEAKEVFDPEGTKDPEKEKEAEKAFHIPDWAFIADMIKYDSRKEPQSPVPEQPVGTPDTIDATIESRTALYDYVVSKSINYNEKIKEFVQFGIKTEKDLTLGDYTVHYMFIQKGFAVAVWKYGDYVSVLTVMEPNTDSECEKAVRDFFE